MIAEERLRFETRRHGIVLVRPLGHALAVAALGAVGFLGGWPISLAGACLLAFAAAAAVAAVWRWDRTHVVLTSDRLLVVRGVLGREQAAVSLARVAVVEVEQSLLGRLLGYGTIVVGDLEIDCVAQPRRLVTRLDRVLSASAAGALLPHRTP